jgi:hypothetical protein
MPHDSIKSSWSTEGTVPRKRGKRNLTAAVLALALMILASPPAPAADPQEIYSHIGKVKVLGDGPHFLDLAGGRFDVFDGDDALAANLEWRSGRKYHFIGPAIGVLANTDGAFFGYGAIHADFAIDPLSINLSWGAGGYHRGDSRELGGVFQFIENLTVAYPFENGLQAGVRYQHISNADLHKKNPGNDSFFLSIAWPF